MLMIEANLRLPKRNPKTLRRARLLDQLHSNAHRKLTFVCAPAGYGKTTLLVDFAEDVDGEIFWYRITQQDTSLASFFENISKSIQVKNPRIGESFSDVFQSGGQSPRFLAMALVGAIEEFVGQYSFLVIDDYHLVSDIPEIVEFLEHLLEFLPDQLRLVIGSRSVYGIPTASLYIQEQLAVIGATELAFRPDELQELCSQYYQINLTERQTKRIIEESEGWIVAILLALRTESSTIEIPKILGAREHIYRYLANDVVSALPDYLHEFMFATSIVEEFTPSFADYLLEIDNSENIIQELGELNLFLSDTESSDEPVYRYHQLFSDFLQEHLGEKLQDRFVTFHLRAASWYEQSGEPEKTVSHYLEAKKFEQAALVMDDSAHEFYLSGQINVLRNWYQSLVEEGDFRRLAPILLLDLAKTEINQGEHEFGTELLNIAEEVLRERKDYGFYTNLLVSRGMQLMFLGRYLEALQIAEEAQKLVVEHELNKYYWNQAERLKGLVSYYLGHVEDAFEYLENAATAFREAIERKLHHDQIHDLITVLSDIGFFGISTGRIFAAQKSFREAVDLTKRLRGNYVDVAMANNNYAYLNYLLGDYVEAWRAYALAMEAAKTYNLEKNMVSIINGQADVLIDIREYDDARKMFQQALELAEKIGEKGPIVAAYSGLVNVEVGAEFFNKALYYIREIARVKNEDASLAEYQVRFGKVYLAMGQLDLARESFDSALKEWGDDLSPQQGIVDGYFHFACALYMLSEEEKSLDYLKRAFKMAASLGYDQFLVVSGRKHDAFLTWASAQWASPQLTSLINRAREVPISKDRLDKPPEEREKVEKSLQVTAFGRDVVRLDGEVIRNTKWYSVGARAMFFFILDRKKVTKEEIALEFWPDFSPGKVNSNFHATLWRVRNALGGKAMIQFKGNSYSINPDVQVHYDVQQFEKLVAKMELPLSETEMRTLLRQIEELYQDDFLLNIDMAWADQKRFELRNDFLHALSILAEIELGRNNFREALGMYENLLSLDGFQDAFHLAKMKCLVGLGNVQGARQHYFYYKDLLEKELGITPDSEITEFFKNL
jgi:ATP/maltotriose-dependent transcriptional regulator MalT/two-component SAPR family response regulator